MNRKVTMVMVSIGAMAFPAYLILGDGFAETRFSPPSTDLAGCYATEGGDLVRITEDGLLRVGQGSTPALRLRGSQDNQGEFLQTQPSVVFVKDSNGGPLQIAQDENKRVTFSVVRGLGSEPKLETWTSTSSKLIFKRIRCPQVPGEGYDAQWKQNTLDRPVARQLAGRVASGPV